MVKIRKCNTDAESLLKEASFQTWAEHGLQKDFGLFARERMKAYHLKQSGSVYRGPLKELNTVRFTNPYRMLDRVSQSLITQISNHKKVDENRIVKTYVFGVFNEPSTYTLFEDFLDGSQEETVKSVLTLYDHLKSQEYKMFRGAYLMNGSAPYRAYLELLPEIYRLQQFFDDTIHSIADLFEFFNNLRGFGNFLSYQMALMINYGLPRSFPINFVVPGPGSARGINWMYGSTKMTEKIAIIKYITKYQDELLSAPDDQWSTLRLPDHPLQENDVQNLFCEYSKLINHRIFDGRVHVYASQSSEPLTADLPKGYMF